MRLLSEDVIQYMSLFMDVCILSDEIYCFMCPHSPATRHTECMEGQRARHLPLTKHDPFICQVEEDNYWKQYYLCIAGVRYSERHKSNYVTVSEDGLEAVCYEQYPFFIV